MVGKKESRPTAFSPGGEAKGGWFGRWWPKKRAPEPSGQDENILVISDIHLGEDVLAEGPEHLAGYIRVLNRELADFVSAHREPKRARRWHLVINGDMFDFVKVSVHPGEEADGSHESAELTTQSPRDLVLYKLDRILEIHRPLFKELGAFLMGGNRITIIEGNHDAEFYFPEVRKRLRAYVVAEGIKVARQWTKDALPSEADIGERLRFSPWFIAKNGSYHIEHGHQYDEYCSFEYNLAPVEHDSEHAIAHPMSHRVLPYFADLLGDFSTHGVDQWSLGQWFRFVFSLGPRMVGVLFKVYFAAMYQLLRQAGRKREDALRQVAHMQRERLDTLARESHYGQQILHNLQRLRARPAEYSVLKMMHVFYLDRLLIGAVTVLMVLLGALIGERFGWSLAGGALLVGGGAMAVLARARVSTVDEKLRVAAAQIAEETGARYVVFGHSHHPELVDLKARYGVGKFGESAFYLNGGSWVTREILQGESGQGMTYVEINDEGAALKRWRGAKAEPAVLASSKSSAHAESESVAAVVV